MRTSSDLKADFMTPLKRGLAGWLLMSSGFIRLQSPDLDRQSERIWK